MSAVGFLKRVAQVLEDRGAAYGDPKTQMEAIARRWSITLGTPVTAQQVALCMIDLKLARLDQLAAGVTAARLALTTASHG